MGDVVGAVAGAVGSGGPGLGGLAAGVVVEVAGADGLAYRSSGGPGLGGLAAGVWRRACFGLASAASGRGAVGMD